MSDNGSTSRRSFLLIAGGLCATAAIASSRFLARREESSQTADGTRELREPLGFDAFMERSAQLTGVPRGRLDEAAGRVYWASLRGAAAEIDETAILLCWYTGKYAAADGARVHTWDGALAWTTLGFTTAQMQCHPDWWAPPAQLPG